MLLLAKRSIFLLLAIVSVVALCFAQFSAETSLVVLHASVTDKKGHLVQGLKEKDFKVFENGVQQPIKLFKHEDVPVSMGLLIDDSGSMRDKRSRVEAAALALVRASNPQDEVFVVNFNDEAYLDVPFTHDQKKMEQGLSRIDSRGGTAMRDAINMSIDYVKANGKHDKKVLVIVTDGNDNASATSLERVVQRAIQSEVLIYAVGLLEEEQRHEAAKAKRALKELTSATGACPFTRRRSARLAVWRFRLPAISAVNTRLPIRLQDRTTAAIAKLRWSAPPRVIRRSEPVLATTRKALNRPRQEPLPPPPARRRALSSVLRFLWISTSGSRLSPWRSPYLKWRIETYSGMKAEKIGFADFWRFVWNERRSLLRYLAWVHRNR